MKECRFLWDKIGVGENSFFVGDTIVGPNYFCWANLMWGDAYFFGAKLIFCEGSSIVGR